jgi:hypothetical protein
MWIRLNAFALAIPPNTFKPGADPYDQSEWVFYLGFKSWHPGGQQFVYVDGSVHFINDSIALGVYRAMATINRGEVVTPP